MNAQRIVKPSNDMKMNDPLMPITWDDLLNAGDEFGMPERIMDVVLGIRHNTRRKIITLHFTERDKLRVQPQTAMALRAMRWIRDSDIVVDWSTIAKNMGGWTPVPAIPVVPFSELYRVASAIPVKNVDALPDEIMRTKHMTKSHLIGMLNGNHVWRRDVFREGDSLLPQILYGVLVSTNSLNKQTKLFNEFVDNVVDPEMILRTGVDHRTNYLLMHQAGRRMVAWKRETLEENIEAVKNNILAKMVGEEELRKNIIA